MLFEIIRASVACMSEPEEIKEKPCDGCTLMPIAIPDNGDVKHLKLIYADRVGDSVVTAWGIEINSPDEFVQLSEKVNYPLILISSLVDGKTPCIMIYDDYIE